MERIGQEDRQPAGATGPRSWSRWRRWIGLLALGVLASSAGRAAAERFPYETDAATETYLTAGAVLTLGTAYLTAGRVDPLTPAEVERLDAGALMSLDRSATCRWSPISARWSDYLVAGLVAAPATLLAAEPAEDAAGVTLAIWGETLLLTTGVVQLTKAVVRRTRPYAYHPDPVVPMDKRLALTTRRSFPSGHAARAFAMAVMLSSMYSEMHPGDAAKEWVWGASLSAAATVSLLRYLAGYHFPTDVLAGAAIGAGLGYAVPRWHEKETSGDPAADPAAALHAPPAAPVRFGLTIRF